MIESRCPGCRAFLPDTAGPTHPYMLSSPACWARYGELGARIMSGTETGPGDVGCGHHVDCYAVQHPSSAEHDRRQRQSVAVHLISLCLLLEFDQPATLASARRGRTSRRVLRGLGLTDWPYLPPPLDLGAVTAADVHGAGDPDEFAGRLREWTHSAWSAWADHHDTIRAWARRS